MNQQPTKRRNPFDIQRDITHNNDVQNISEEAREQPVNTDNSVRENIYNQQQAYQPIQKVVKSSKRQQYIQIDEEKREKYTSTMDIELRRRIKIVCATRGIMFAQFIEDACREKLAREGIK